MECLGNVDGRSAVLRHSPRRRARNPRPRRRAPRASTSPPLPTAATNTTAAHGRTDFGLLDIYENAAVSRVDAGHWVDYLQLAKWNGRWVIVNVLWELRPQAP
jgi:hypothetical protein